MTALPRNEATHVHDIGAGGTGRIQPGQTNRQGVGKHGIPRGTQTPSRAGILGQAGRRCPGRGVVAWSDHRQATHGLAQGLFPEAGWTELTDQWCRRAHSTTDRAPHEGLAQLTDAGTGPVGGEGRMVDDVEVEAAVEF
jgi:hypothetical protein